MSEIERFGAEPEVVNTEREAITQAIESLQDALVELEVWRQNARSGDERQSLHRVTTLLSMTANELRTRFDSTDPAQRSFPFVRQNTASPEPQLVLRDDP